jgi:hypothetical protein
MCCARPISCQPSSRKKHKISSIFVEVTYLRTIPRQIDDYARDLVQEAKEAIDKGTVVEVLPYQRALQPNRHDLLMQCEIVSTQNWQD